MLHPWDSLVTSNMVTMDSSNNMDTMLNMVNKSYLGMEHLWTQRMVLQLEVLWSVSRAEVVGSKFLLSMEVTSVMARLLRKGSVSLLSVWDHQDLRDLQAGLVCQEEMEHQEHQDLLV